MTGIFTYKNFSLSDTPPLVHKVALVTGGAAGIGQEITAQLLLHDIEKVFVVARTASKFERSRQEWNDRRGIKLLDSSMRAEFVPCDLGDISQSQKAAREIIMRTSRLDIVVCNAATLNTPSFNPIFQNLDPILATNHVGHHVLVTALLPLLSSTATTYDTNPRIIITTSSLHHFCRALSVPDLSIPTMKWPASYDSIWRYGRSKLCNILFTKELSRRLMSSSEPGADKIYVNCYFPGNIATDAMDTWKVLFGSVIGWMFKTFFKVAGQGVQDAAATVLFLGTAQIVVEKGIRGRYFVPIATEAAVSGLGGDERLAGEVWAWTEEVARKGLGS